MTPHQDLAITAYHDIVGDIPHALHIDKVTAPNSTSNGSTVTSRVYVPELVYKINDRTSTGSRTCDHLNVISQNLTSKFAQYTSAFR